jgi:hypothetical protein
MMPGVVKQLFIDINILVYANVSSAPQHAAALNALTQHHRFYPLRPPDYASPAGFDRPITKFSAPLKIALTPHPSPNGRGESRQRRGEGFFPPRPQSDA